VRYMLWFIRRTLLLICEIERVKKRKEQWWVGRGEKRLKKRIKKVKKSGGKEGKGS